MKIRSTINGGLAEVDDDFAVELIAAGAWEAVDAPKPARKPRSPRTPKPAPAEEPKSEE
ncbi:head-to-tail connector protein [Mycobacterium phage BobSwaget]|nr:head-to-tail connector protein [Mycobacterium phage BobSwaget]